MNQPILLIDDEKGILDMLTLVLKKEGFRHIHHALTGAEAVAMAYGKSYDLVVLDVTLPDIDGFEVCRRLRQTMDMPILFLTSRTTDLDKLTGFAMGGDDYITKPFNPLEVAARMKAQLRRQNQKSNAKQAPRFDYGYFVVDKEGGQLVVDGCSVECPAREFALLTFFCEHPNRIFSIRQLYEQVWGDEYLGDEKTVAIHISRLRKKIESDASKPQFLLNVRGLGYKIVKPEKKGESE
ncbi:DNA-binding response regulator [Paenibacillus glucanolyticus]|uniref:DNA-binding response regulator n=1 Tax=Paenibacillus glucanolyticus TaxID=59843 RepID=A0A163DK12_9BACL|nr:response regulator transcription factor [Paenibacillus glucanolyticus]KZS43279.1 DNA-binding response regulator [Paenibacillus glucanolyticus]